MAYETDICTNLVSLCLTIWSIVVIVELTLKIERYCEYTIHVALSFGRKTRPTEIQD